VTSDFPPVLAGLIPRLGSSFDGEILATVHAIGRALKTRNLDWHDLAKTVTAQSLPAQWNYEPRRTESDEVHRMRAWLTAISREDWLNAWTAGFVSDLLLRSSLDGLTGKQTACVDRIIRQARDRGVRVVRRAA
jgi:hypothetical protein